MHTLKLNTIIGILKKSDYHYDDVIMTMLASQITSLTVVYSIVYSGVNQRKHHSSASLAFVREIHRGPVNFPHKWPVTRKMFPFDDVIMTFEQGCMHAFSTWWIDGTCGFFLPGISELNNGCPVDQSIGVGIKEERGGQQNHIINV